MTRIYLLCTLTLLGPPLLCILGFCGETCKALLELYKRLATYCCSIWDPYHQSSVHKLELIQHHACFVLNKPWHKNTQDSITRMLEILKWPSLQKRRKMPVSYYYSNLQTIIPRNYMPSPSPLSTTRAQHNLKYVDAYAADIRNLSVLFFPRTIPKWNNLHTPNLDNLTLNEFISKL